MVKFELPVSGGRPSNISSKEITISTYQGNLIRSPYDGVVESVDVNDCGGNVKIKHTVGNDIFHSNLCEVNRITVNRGDNIRKGSSIGIMGDKDITYSVLDSSSRKIRVKPFFSGIDNNSKKSTEPKKEPKRADIDKKDPTANLGLPKDDNGQDIFSKVGLAPFNLMDKIFNIKPVPLSNESIMEDEVLQEELKRIKKLL